jgi:hypothetical protein
VLIAKASGAAIPATPTASVTLKAMAVVGAIIKRERPTTSISPRLRRSPMMIGIRLG